MNYKAQKVLGNQTLESTNDPNNPEVAVVKYKSYDPATGDFIGWVEGERLTAKEIQRQRDALNKQLLDLAELEKDLLAL